MPTSCTGFEYSFYSYLLLRLKKLLCSRTNNRNNLHLERQRSRKMFKISW